MKRYQIFFSVFVLATLCGCVATGPEGKTSLVIIPTSQEVAIGEAMAQEIATTEKKLPDSVWQSYLTEVGRRLVQVCDRKDIEYRFTVIESDQINAFAAPGGYVYFYTGLLHMMDNEAELASVMAHEISHVVARHGAKRLQAALGVSLAYELVFGKNSSQTMQAAVGVGMSLLFANYSRENEREADDYAVTYMIRSGYDPSAMETMFGKLASSGTEQNAFEKPLPPNLSLGRERYQQMVKRLPPGK
jgi:predicted Zn-dependent protease